ncbi:hypothetical protein DFH08DRAFT_885905 [Mycena albidolilacea]|uniref:Secreted protein n=1 Tax=Mycena albidolilacea TaxID=1033008 RepID=A0AAD6ZL60_9AGAR|nr:hypothetical protein DFH08DRAFT_885905 [Mycena albidolilacea]
MEPLLPVVALNLWLLSSCGWSLLTSFPGSSPAGTTWELNTCDILPATLLKVPPSMWVPLREKLEAMAKVVDRRKGRGSDKLVSSRGSA